MAFFDKKAQVANSNVNQGMVECDRRLTELAQNRAAVVMQIGQLFLASNTPESVKGSPYEELVSSVAAIDQEADYQEKRKLAIQGLRKCEKCGNILVLDSAFCNKCGEKLESLFAEQNKAQNICPQCGSTYAEGAAFCTSCGNKLG
ncbi:MAG: zinc ribbon domain-containing protein [Acetatifactor sp.]|nr:zinc ribbon domain-containing protein [Acetatifactor sp.]